MHKIVFATALSLFLSVPCLAATYGKGVTIEKPTPITQIVADPQAFSGKTVLVKGMVVDVCRSRGCWLELAGEKPYETLRIKVEDGVIVFPLSARGKQALVQGVVESVRLCPDEARRMRQAEAKAKGVPYTDAMITGTESTFTLRATGARVD